MAWTDESANSTVRRMTMNATNNYFAALIGVGTLVYPFVPVKRWLRR